MRPVSVSMSSSTACAVGSPTRLVVHVAKGTPAAVVAEWRRLAGAAS